MVEERQGTEGDSGENNPEENGVSAGCHISSWSPLMSVPCCVSGGDPEAGVLREQLGRVISVVLTKLLFQLCFSFFVSVSAKNAILCR